jgi:peptidoglycan/xylan/chitin deacetylase (PgdA/CDA1 family)
LKKNGNRDRKVIFTLIDIFEKYNIPVTWAVVGHLFLDRCSSNMCLTSTYQKKFSNIKKWHIDPYSDIEKDPLFYGKDIIDKIISSSINHEIGYHSFSHPRFDEIPREMAEAEIKEAKKIEKEWKIKFKSFVFPANKIKYVDILKENGFKIYRGDSPIIWNPNQNFFTRIFTGGISKIIAPPVEPIWMNGIWEIQSSLFFSDKQIPQSLLLRAKIGVERTIKNKKVFHICFHPWDLLIYDRLRQDLETFLKYICKKMDNRKLTILTMGELADYLDSKKVS